MLTFLRRRRKRRAEIKLPPGTAAKSSRQAGVPDRGTVTGVVKICRLPAMVPELPLLSSGPGRRAITVPRRGWYESRQLTVVDIRCYCILLMDWRRPVR